MIKLIVSDMDGSLLTHEKHLPPDFFEVFDELQRRGIAFAAASGRTYLTLLQHFESIADKMHFIANNGTSLYMYNKNVQNLFIPDKAWRRAAAVCSGRDGVAAIVNGVHGDYVMPFRHDAGLANIIDGGFAALRVVESMDNVCDEIFKIGICDKHGPQHGLYDDVLAAGQNEYDAVISGPQYMDVMPKNASKGSALKALQEKLGVQPCETMAFGDFYNDVSLLKNSEHSFVMANAPADMRAYAKHVAKSNSEFGVTHAIKEFVLA